VSTISILLLSAIFCNNSSIVIRGILSSRLADGSVEDGASTWGIASGVGGLSGTVADVQAVNARGIVAAIKASNGRQSRNIFLLIIEPPTMKDVP
jgi:hypothetical protein